MNWIQCLLFRKYSIAEQAMHVGAACPQGCSKVLALPLLLAATAQELISSAGASTWAGGEVVTVLASSRVHCNVGRW
jgi:hypothetical protein